MPHFAIAAGHDLTAAACEDILRAGAIATPGLAPGLAEAHARFGRMPLRDLVVPAVRAARAGVTVTDFQASLGRIIAPILQATSASRALMCGEDGKPLAPGTRYRNPDFADVLEVFGLEGPRFVTEGEVAAGLLALAGEGGHLGPGDLKSYRPQWRRPVEVTRGRARIAVNPPPALGGVLVAFALELIGPEARVVDLARAFEATTRARVEAGLPDDIEADPEGGPEDRIMRLLSPGLVARYRAELQGRKAATRGTTQISVVDGTGMGAALTISNGEGNGSIIPGTGIMPNNMLGEDDLVPGAWHSWASDTRLASMMTPMAVSWPDGALAMLGSGGSNRIRTALAQVLVNLLDRGMALGDAVEAPRLHVEGGSMKSRPPAVDFELPGLAEEDRAAILAAFGQARGWAERSMFYGGVHAVTRDRHGNVHAAGDPRRAGVVSGFY